MHFLSLGALGFRPRMQRLVILFSLLVLGFDLADCALLGGPVKLSASSSLNRAGDFFLPPACQHLKDFSGKEDPQVVEQLLGLPAQVPWTLLQSFCPHPAIPAFSFCRKASPFLFVAGSGGLPR